MATTRPFKPLMIAIHQVLKELGTPSALQHPLNERAQKLQDLYNEYDSCCCQRAEVVAEVAPVDSQAS